MHGNIKGSLVKTYILTLYIFSMILIFFLMFFNLEEVTDDTHTQILCGMR